MTKARLRFAGLLVVCSTALPAPAAARLVVRQLVTRGDVKVTTRVMATRMHMYPGDTVDFDILNAAEQRLIESDLFSSVHVFVDLPLEEAVRDMFLDDHIYLVDVVVEAVGKEYWFIFPTASFGTGNWGGGIAYANQNFIGRDVELVATVQYGELQKYVFAGFRDPLLAVAPITYEMGALYRLEQICFYTNHNLFMQVPTTMGGVDGRIGWVLSPHTRALIGFSARDQQVGAVENLAAGGTPLPYNAHTGRVFLLQFQFQYDDTRAPEGIRTGVRLFLKNEVSDLYWGSDFDYSKFETHVEFYGHYGWNYPSLIIDAALDYPTSSRGVPVVETLHLGGPNLRGYIFNEFHGDTLVSTQLEDQAVILHLHIPWTQVKFNVAAAVFVDAGILLERFPGGTTVPPPGIAVSPARGKLGDIHVAPGGGLRIILPGVMVPAVKLDVGYGIDVRSVAFTVSVAGGLM